MTTAELKTMIETCDAHIKTLDGRLASTPTDTTAHDAMTQGRRDILKHRHYLDSLLDARGA